MQKKYQVFVSSTFVDLADERQDAIRTILDLGHIPAGMELFPAADTEQLEYIKKVIDECDYYILIMGGRYGSLDEAGVSFTEREYDYAVETGKTVLAFIHADPPSLPLKKNETSERMQAHLSAFRQKVMSGRLVREWKDRAQLDGLVIKSLARAVSDFPAIGWVRADGIASEKLMQDVHRLREDNANMAAENEQLRQSLAPNTDGLAKGDALHTLRFKYRKMGSRSYVDAEKAVELTWDEIFRAVAERLTVSRPTSQISSYLSDYLKENKGDKSKGMHLFETDLVIVKHQLVGLGLLSTKVGKSSNGQVYEWMTLTSSGRTKLAGMLAVKAH